MSARLETRYATFPSRRRRILPNAKVGRMKLMAMVTDPKGVTRFLQGLFDPSEAPERVFDYGRRRRRS
jgi:hypothetical protein